MKCDDKLNAFMFDIGLSQIYQTGQVEHCPRMLLREMQDYFQQMRTAGNVLLISGKSRSHHSRTGKSYGNLARVMPLFVSR